MIFGELSKYDQAVATWVERHEGLPAGSVGYIEFTGLEGCDTCGSGSGAALDYMWDQDGKRRSGTVLLEYPLSPGKFIEECAAILADAERQSS